MIVYFRCLCKVSDKMEAKRLKDQYSAEIRIVKDNSVWRQEAASYGMRLPFIVENGEARPLWT